LEISVLDSRVKTAPASQGEKDSSAGWVIVLRTRKLLSRLSSTRATGVIKAKSRDCLCIASIRSSMLENPIT
jgi:hypothetical protein